MIRPTFHILGVALGVFGMAAFFLFAGCEKREFPLPDHPGGQLYNGVKRGDVRCYRCHGDVGAGYRGPTLVHPGKPIDRQMFVKTVQDGRGNMPAFGSALSENDILQIIDWLEKASGSPAPSGAK